MRIFSQTVPCFFVAVMALQAEPATSAPNPPISLAATASGPFALGQPVVIELQLTNVSTKPMAVSEVIDGNINVSSFTRDGGAVPTRTSFVVFDDDLPFAQRRNLRVLAPGESTILFWRSSRDVPLNGQAIHAVTAKKKDVNQTSYSIASVGTYRVSLRYQYQGAKAKGQPVFKGRTNQVDLTFTVQ